MSRNDPPPPPYNTTISEVMDCTSLRRLFVTCDVFTHYFFVAFSWFFSWLFRGPHLLGKTVFGPFSWLFRFGQILRVLALEKSSESLKDYATPKSPRRKGSARNCLVFFKE